MLHLPDKDFLNPDTLYFQTIFTPSSKKLYISKYGIERYT